MPEQSGIHLFLRRRNNNYTIKLKIIVDNKNDTMTCHVFFFMIQFKHFLHRHKKFVHEINQYQEF